MASLMQRFLKCDLNPPPNQPGQTTPATPQDRALCDAAMHMLKSQMDRDDIPRYLESQDTSTAVSAIANKTGALDATRNDVGIVFTPHGPILISAFTYDNHDQSWTPDNEGQLLIAQMAKAIVTAWTADH
jgi:beta-lactamase class A